MEARASPCINVLFGLQLQEDAVITADLCSSDSFQSSSKDSIQVIESEVI